MTNETLAQLHFDKRQLYLKYQGHMVEVQISHSGNSDPQVPIREDDKSDSGDTFDEFTYEDEDLNGMERYHTEELVVEEVGLYDNPWADVESPAIYLTIVEGTLIQQEKPLKSSINEYLEEFIQVEGLNERQQKRA